jgi:hypothetical protein
MIIAHNISDRDLLNYNQLGLVPGPDESEADFYARAEECLKLKEKLSSDKSLQLPFEAKSNYSTEVLEESYPKTKELFGIQTSWLPIFFSNYQLAPWHGGCAWIFQLKTEGPRVAFLQLRQVFSTQKTHLKIYSRDELVAHESAHVGRMMFDEEQFEEILAYRTSPSTWRQWVGPLVQSAFESLFFICVLFAVILLDLYLLITQNYEAYLNLAWLKIFPAGLLFFAFMRLWNRHRIFQKCLGQLLSTFRSAKFADHVIYRLTDKEIISFANSTPASIVKYSREERDKSLRWRLIDLAYFTDINEDLIYNGHNILN